MTSFVLTFATTAAQTLASNEIGLISPSGVMAVTGAPAVSMAGGTNLTVLGALTALSGVAGAVSVSGAGSKVSVGANGYLSSLNGTAINVTTGGLFWLQNSGQIIGETSACRMGPVAGTLRIVNTGDMIASSTSGIEGYATALSIINHGTIQSGGAGYGILTESASIDIANTGWISSIFVGGTTASSSQIQNSGAIRGLVWLGSGNDIFRGADGTVGGAIDGNAGNDWFATGRGDNLVRGGDGADTIDAGQGDDTVNGDGGNDLFHGNAGSDSIDGGTGVDMLDYRRSTAAIEVDLLSGEGFGGDAEGDSILRVENLRGTAFADSITGNDSANLLRGGAGADRIDGGSGNDTLRGDGGADTLIGNGGSDTVTYQGTQTGLVINLQTGQASGGHAQGDVFNSIENVVGSEVADSLLGNSVANRLTGGGGGDYISGGGGDDTLTGGIGSAGDTFYFNTSDGNDVITDLQIGIDVLDFSAFNFNDAVEALNQADFGPTPSDVTFDFTTLGFGCKVTLQGINVPNNDLFLLLDSIMVTPPE